MANVTAVSEHPALVETGASEQVLALNADREYSLTHLGLDAAGNSDTALVFAATQQLVGADLLPRDDKLVLRGLATATFGPGVGRLALRAPGGGPLVQLIPGPRRHGAW
jgi:hypothetical protein